jgi:hypothetical protein
MGGGWIKLDCATGLREGARMKRLLLGLICILLGHVVLASGADAVRKQAQASMLVMGSIDVAPDGSVQSYAIDHADKLPPVVVELLDKNVPTWKFEPVCVDGKPVLATAKMSLRIVARRSDDHHFSAGIVGAQFGQDHEVATDSISYKTREQPHYPAMAVENRVSGTVYLLLRVGRQGQVEDAATEQVNLGVYASEVDMERFRSVLATAALKASEQWTFNVPTTGKHVTDDYWVARVPVNFSLSADRKPDLYGQWQSYVPGPRQLVPWIEKGRLMAGDADATPAGGIYQLEQGLHLTTSLGGS